MPRPSLYSLSPQRQPPPVAGAAEAQTELEPQADPPAPTLIQRLRYRLHIHRVGVAVIGLAAALVAAGWPGWVARHAPQPSLDQINAALREALTKEPLPSPGVAAYEAILPSVVRVVGLAEGETDDDEATAPPPSAAPPAHSLPSANPTPRDRRRSHPQDGPDTSRPPQRSARASPQANPYPHGAEGGRSVGTGVVVVDKGLILTSLHVVEGAARIRVTFFDGSSSDALVVSRQPDNDLAVLQAKTIPDDLHAATLRSTGGLAPGDAVLAVGFPFGIGPSASQGVVSGLKREFRAPGGQRILTNLIQFDAAANPGNSGGPLVTMDGHVVGIVAAIMNPNMQRTFIGIGFAVPIENAAAAVGMPPF